MCNKAPGKRCAGHIGENINSLETQLAELAESTSHKAKVIAFKKSKNPNFGNADEEAEMNETLRKEQERAADLREQLHAEKAAYYLTETGKQSLQDIIDNPNSSPAELLDAQINHATALTREAKDAEVLKIVKDENLDLIDKEEMLKIKIGSVDKEVASVKERLAKLDQNLEAINEKISRYRIRGEDEKAREWTKVARGYSSERQYLVSYKNQLESHKVNINRYLNRRLRDEEKTERAKQQELRQEQARKDQARTRRAAKWARVDRFMDKLIRNVIMKWT